MYTEIYHWFTFAVKVLQALKIQNEKDSNPIGALKILQFPFLLNLKSHAIKIYQININHRKRISGKTNVFHLNKIPLIALRNIFGLIKLRFMNIIY